MADLATFTATVGTPVVLAAAADVYNAFPGVVRCANGDLLAGWRRSGGHTAGGPAVFRRSVDNGLTWGSETSQLDGYAITYGTVTLSVTTDGTVFMAGWLRATPEVAVIHRSTGHGVTFGPSVTIDHGFTGPAVIEGPVVEAANGDLLVAVWGRNTEDAANRTSVKVLRSTDGGATFASPVTLANGPVSGRYWNEAGIYVLADGSVDCVIREETAPVQLWVARSRDGGVTFSSVSALHGWGTGKWSGAPKPTHTGGIDAVVWVARDVSAADAAHLIATRGLHYRSQLLDPGKMMYGQVCPIDADTIGAVYALEVSSVKSDVYFVPVDVAVT